MAFRMYDCNGDGSIDETEMRRIISVSLKLTEDNIFIWFYKGYLWINWWWNRKTRTTNWSRRTCNEYINNDG